ncbi:MAG: nucleotide exchange factor GrpE [Phycisphaerales bacterium]
MSDPSEHHHDKGECCGGPHDSGCCGGEPGGPDQTIAALTAERDDAIEKWRRAVADFQNFHRRSIENEREARRQGVTAVLSSIIPVLDHFDLALSHSGDNAATAQIVEGVKVIREELLKALAQHGISVISPAPGDELDPHLHQVIVQQPAVGVPPGKVSMTLQAGYLLEQRVVRPAKVAVAPRPAEG